MNDDLAPEIPAPSDEISITGTPVRWLIGHIVLPGLVNQSTTGPMVREAQRHLAGWVLQPMAELLAEEARAKLGGDVVIDVGRPLQAFDAGGRARALSQLVEAMGRAKELGLTPDQWSVALQAVNWGGGDNTA